MGLGLLGRGVGDAQFLAEQGAEVVVTDLKTKDELAPSVHKLEQYETISFVLGEHREKDFTNTDMVIKSAGVPLDSPYVAIAREAGVPVTMSTALFAAYTPATIIGVTGTRGKSTTAHLISHILTQAGKQVFLGGNVQNVSTLAHLPKSTAGEIAVLELDSWQLQGFGTENISPHIAVFTTFMNDHMDYYQGDTDRYLADKANIFLYQTNDDIVILGEQCAHSIQETYSNIASSIQIASANDIPHDWIIPLIGEHNRANSACAIKATGMFDIPMDILRHGLESFTGVFGRLDYSDTVHGIDVYNDTTATTPEATGVALQALSDRSIILIAGGSDKGLDIHTCAEKIKKQCKAVVWLPGTGTDRIKKYVSDITEMDAHTMDEAVASAFDIAETGDVVLLSPGFASFGLFRNEYDRGEHFLQAVQNI